MVRRRLAGTLDSMCGWATDFCKINDPSDSQPKTAGEVSSSVAISIGGPKACANRDPSLQIPPTTAVPLPPPPVVLKAH